MNEEALKYSYDLFIQDGYTGSFEDYKKLINNDKEAFDYSYELFKNDGYTGNVTDFSGILNTGNHHITKQEETPVVEGEQVDENNPEVIAHNEHAARTNDPLGTKSAEEPEELSFGEQIRLAIDTIEDTGLPGTQGAGFLTDKIGKIINWSGFLSDITVQNKKAVIDVATDIGLDFYEPNLSSKEKLFLQDGIMNYLSRAPIIGGFLEQEKMYDAIEEFGTDLQTTGGDYDKSILKNITEGNVGVALDKTIGGIIDSTPSVAMAFMGPGGLAAIGMSSAGSHYEELSEASPEDRGWTMYATSLLQGGIEMASEAVTRSLATRLVKSFKEPTEEAAKGLLRVIGESAFYEGLSEVGSQELNNALDKWFTDGKIDKFYKENGEFDYNGVLERVFDTFLISSIIGGGLGAGTGINNRTRKLAHERLMDPSLQQENLEIITQINKLTVDNKDLNNKTINENIEKLKKKLENNKTYNGIIIDSMDTDAQVNMAENVSAITDARLDLKNNVNTYTQAQKESLENVIKQKSDENNRIWNDSAKAWKEGQKEKIKQNIAKQIAAVENVEGINALVIKEDADLDVAKERLIELERKGKLGKNNTVESVLEQIKQDKGKNLQYRENGRLITEVFVNEAKAIENFDKAVGSHEILHSVLGNAIGIEPKLFKKGYEGLRKYLNKNNSELVKEIDQDLKNKGYSNIEQFEEFFNAVSDKMVKGQISYNKTLGDTLLQFFNKMLKPVFGDNTFTDGRQAFNFLQDFSKSMAKGSLSNAARGYLQSKAIGEGSAIKSSKALIDSGFDPVANKAKIDNLLKENLETFNKGGEGKGKLTQQIAKEYAPLMTYYATRPQPKTGKTPFSRLDGFNMQDYLTFAETELALHIANFDPEVNDSLDGWIMGQAYNKALNALNALDIDIQIEQSLLDEANAILSTDLQAETIIDKQPLQPKRKRRNLIKDILNGKELEPLVKDVIEKSLEDNIDLIGTTEFRPKMLESFNQKLGPELKKILNTTPKFEDFIRTNFDYIYKALPQSIINKRYKEFAEKKLNEDGTPYRQTVDEVRGYNNMVENGFIEGKPIADVKSGPPKFIKKKITKREFAEYFVSKSIAPSKRGTRKTSLLGSVAEILADDLTFKTLSDPALIYKYQEGRQESVENIIEKIKKDFGKDVEQDVIIKSSLSLPAQVDAIENYVEYVRGEAYRGQNINTIIKDYTKGKSKDVKDFLKPIITKTKENWKISGLDVTIKELKAIKDLENLTPEGVDVNFDSYKNMNEFVNEQNLNPIDLMTEEGESQYLGFVQDFSNTLDPKFVESSIFGLTIGGGVVSMYSSGTRTDSKGNKVPQAISTKQDSEFRKNNFVLNNKINDFTGINSEGKVIFNPKDAVAISASTLNTVEKLIVEAGNPQTEQGQKELADKINKFITPEKRKALQGARDYFYKKLNDYYQNAPNKTLAASNIAKLLQLQSSLSSGIPRQGAVVTSVSLTPGYNKVVKGMFDLFQREHNIQNLNFNVNVLKSIIGNKFNDLYPLYSAKYTQTILDSDAKIALDEGMITEDLIKKYPTFKTEDTGKTTFTKGFEIGMPSESMQILAGIPASSILDLETGLTLDKVIHNKIASKKALDALDAFTIRLKQDMFDQSRKAAENIFNNKNTNALFNNPDNVQVFDEIIIKSSKGEDVKDMMDWLSVRLDNKQNFKNLRKYNEAIIKDSKQPINKEETTNQMLDDMKDLDKKAQDARMKESKDADLNKEFNEILEETTGIGKEKQYGKAKAEVAGKDKGKFDVIGIPPSAQDFVGLVYKFIGKGKVGDKQLKWIKKNLTDPFARAQIDISNARVSMANDFKELKKILKITSKDLNKKIPGEPFTIEQAIRVYTWTKQGMNIPGLSKNDLKELNDFVENDSNLVNFADQLIEINKGEGYPKPDDSWLAGTVTTDLLTSLNTVVRAKYLKQWQANVDQIFSETNLNKLEAIYGKGYRSALENMLGRMKTGSNRGFKGDTLTGRFIDWINNSVGAIMFFNMRSAVLQTISSVNFINWSDNSVIQAAKAFANQPQYWGDVVKLMNSDYLIERRNGLKINVSEADIAQIAAESKNKGKAFVSKLLKLGFLPTQIADSFAIATGGAAFYRNRLNSLLKTGMSQSKAETQAFQDFREISEESQQSSRPDRISAQQAGPMGRIILAFANTPAQYARLIHKAASDLKNGRGDAKTNVSKIIYYGMVQNVMFNALQQALFALAFEDEEPDEEIKNKKYANIINGMADSLLRGTGFAGAAVATVKNALFKMAEGKKAQDSVVELLSISPPISSKYKKVKSAGRTWDWNQKEMREKGWSFDNPAWLAIGQVISASTNVPVDRGIKKITNLKDAMDQENEEWMRIANALGWQKWELEWPKIQTKSKSKIKVY